MVAIMRGHLVCSPRMRGCSHHLLGGTMSIVVLPRIRGGDPENSPDFATMGGSVPRIFGVDLFSAHVCG